MAARQSWSGSWQGYVRVYISVEEKNAHGLTNGKIMSYAIQLLEDLC